MSSHSRLPSPNWLHLQKVKFEYGCGRGGELAETATCPVTSNCWNSSRILVRKPEGGLQRVVPGTGSPGPEWLGSFGTQARPKKFCSSLRILNDIHCSGSKEEFLAGRVDQRQILPEMTWTKNYRAVLTMLALAFCLKPARSVPLSWKYPFFLPPASSPSLTSVISL